MGQHSPEQPVTEIIAFIFRNYSLVGRKSLRRSEAAQAVQQLATGWTIRETNLGEGDFSHLSKQSLGSTQPPVQWVPGLLHGSKAAGAWR
jgi:hypothetical protein